MTHRLLFTIPLLALAACTGPVGPDAIPDPQANALPFDVPMDPGSISCAQLSNPSALAAATEWATGQARAAALAGRSEAVPPSNVLSQNLGIYCSANRSDTVRTATREIGF